MNKPTIKELFYRNTDKICDKWEHYLDIYDRFFLPYRDRPINILEIGVSHGGSLEIWSKYFHTRSNIIGIDIELKCKKAEKGNIKVYIGSQTDKEFLKSIPYKFDIIIDDGSHIQSNVLRAFELLFPKLKNGGLYFVEDLHTAYWKEYGGGLRKNKTFIAKTKSLLDELNYYHIRENVLHSNYLKKIKGIYAADSIIIIEKDNVKIPYPIKTGKTQIC